MLDKTIPHYSLLLYRTETAQYPRHALPAGYEFVFYREGDELAWARIEVSVGQFDTEQEALACFRSEFLENQRLDPRERMLFVKAPDGEYVATATLWDGDYFGEIRQRFHWLAVMDRCAGQGIAKALLTRLMDLYGALGYAGFVYLVTGTQNYQAVGIYRRFGFLEYRGPRSRKEDMSDEEYARYAAQGFALVDRLLEG